MRTLPATVAGSKTARGLATRCALKVSFTSGDYCYTSDGWDPEFDDCVNRQRVTNWGGLNAMLEATDPKAFAQASFVVTIGDPDGELQDRFEDEQLQRLGCEVWWAVFTPGEVAPNYTQAVRILKGTLVPPVNWTEGDRTLQFTVTDLSVYDERLVGVRCTRADFPSIADEDEGRIVPLVYGRVDRIQAAHINRGPVARLLETVDSQAGAATTFLVDDAEDFPQNAPITIRIGKELLTGKFSGNIFLISTRGVLVWNAGSATANSVGTCTLTDTKIGALAVPENAFLGFEIIAAVSQEYNGGFTYIRAFSVHTTSRFPAFGISAPTDQSRFIIRMSKAADQLEWRQPFVVEQSIVNRGELGYTIDGQELGFNTGTGYNIGTRAQCHQDGESVYLWYDGTWDEADPGADWPVQDYIVAMGTCTVRQVYVHGYMHVPRRMLAGNIFNYLGSIAVLESAWRLAREREMALRQDRWIPLSPEMYEVDTTTILGQTVTRIRMVCPPTWSSEYICTRDTLLVDMTGPTDADGDAIQNPAEVIEDVFEVYGGVGPKRDLAAWWKMDEKSGRTAEDSADGSPGTLINDVEFRPDAGRIGGCADFDGGANDEIRVANTAALQAACAGTFTLAFWVKHEHRGGAAERVGLVTKSPETVGGNGFRCFLFRNPVVGNDRVYIECDGSSDANGIYVAKFLPDTWYHICVLVDGTAVAMYVDGTALTMGDANVTNASAVTEPLRMGISWFGGGPTYASRLNGQLDDVRIYDRALNVDEITALASAPTTHVDFSTARASLANWRMSFARRVIAPLRAVAADLASQARSRIRWLDDDPEMLYLGVDGGDANLDVAAEHLVLHSARTSREEMERAASRINARWQRDGKEKIIVERDADVESDIGQWQKDIECWAYEGAGYVTALARYTLDVRKRLHDRVALAATVHGVALQPGDIINLDADLADAIAPAPCKGRVVSVTHDPGREPDAVPREQIVTKLFRWAGCTSACEGPCETTSCEAACETYYEPDDTCWTCETTCQVKCEHVCETGLETFCRDHACETALQLGCAGGCQFSEQGIPCGACQASCQAAGPCQTDCQTYVETSCLTECELACIADCDAACQDYGETACLIGSEQFCMATEQTICGATCQAECQTDCQTECQAPCQVTCQAGCQTLGTA